MKKNKDDFGYLYNEKEHKATIRRDMTLVYDIMTWGFGIFASIFLGVMLIYFVGIKTSMVGAAMEPNLFNGEEVLINRIIYQFSSPKRGDVIAFYPNGNENSHLYVRRILGLPGETIQIKQGSVYINGEMYALDTDTPDAGIAEELIELSNEEYFVIGDNRINCEDSRSANIGNVTLDMIEGKIWYHLSYKDSGMGKVE